MAASLNNLDIDTFVAQYWQQSPLLVRKAIELNGLIDAEELAGLAMEPDVESRILINNVQTDTWQLKHGPFSEDDFASLPASHWTLLVQAVDHWVPEVRSLLKCFHFLPAWRLDDIMISFATDGGGVGPHFDQYDVFLIQLSGKREWKVGQLCDEDSDLVDRLPVKILSEFEDEEVWVMEPGDMLYLPPALAHWGTAQGDCLTLSVGFRAPSKSEVVSDLGHFLASHISDFHRYADPQLRKRNEEPHRIDVEDVARVQNILLEYANNPEILAHWLGHYMTEPKYNDQAVDTGDWSLSGFVNQWQHFPLFRNSSSRMAYYGQTLFIDGQAIETTLTSEKLEWLCQQDSFEYNASPFHANQAFQQALWSLVNVGAVFFEE